MKAFKNRNYSYLYSITIHSMIIIILSFFRYTFTPEVEEYVTIGFGTVGRESSSGVIGEKVEVEKEPEKVVEPEEEKVEDKEVELPETVNKDEENIISQVEEEKEEKPPEPEPKVEENVGRENEGDSVGNFGFEIDFGGKGKRRIYSSPLPAYPEGVSKEIDIKLRFSILPDGSVGTIIPLIKADTRLEMAAIYSLRQWRFEPLPGNVKQSEQKAVIIFPYRLQ